MRQLDTQIPGSSEIPNNYQQWQTEYKNIINSSRPRGRFKKVQATSVSTSRCNQNIDTLRDSLNHWLNPVNRPLELAIELHPDDEINVVLQTQNISSESLLPKLPWHWWNLFSQDNFSDVALSFSNSEQVNFMSPEAEPVLPRPKRVKILCVLGDTKGIKVEADRRLLRKIPGAYCVFLRQPTRSEFFNFMEKERWDILFFSGHSNTDNNTGYLKLNQQETLDIQEIREIIQTAIDQYQGMKLAIFNSCDGLGLARKLADLDIAQIIVWREPVPDEVAQEFVKSFLEFFTGQRTESKTGENLQETEGLSLYRSVYKARLEIQKYIENPERNTQIPKISWLPVIHHNLAKESITWQQLRGLPDIGSDENPPTTPLTIWVILTIWVMNIWLKVRNLFQNQEKSDTRAATPRESLLNRVEEFWIKGVLEKSLHIEETLELGLMEDKNLVGYPSSEQPESSELQKRNLPEGTRAIDIFGELEGTRKMLILGRSGSGKTTALLEIARESINDAKRDINLPIPVVLNLSSWAAEKEPKPLANWLAQELNRIYQFSQKQCNAWVTKQQLLLLLDGLDEVRESKRGDCIIAINQFLRDYEETEMVVCSRIRDYRQVSERLQFQTAVFYRQLTEEQINRYFDDAGEALSGVQELKKEDKAIQTLVKSPLTLNFISVAYKDNSREELLEIGSLEKRLNHLFNTYIKRRFEERKIKYSERQLKYWLSWLAQKITQRDRKELLIEHIQPDWLPGQQWAYNLGFRVILGLIVGLIGVLHFGILVTNDLGVQISLIIPSVIAGVVSCLSFPMLSNLIPRITPSFRLGFIPQQIFRFLPGIVSGVIYAIIIYLMVDPIVAESIEHEARRSILSPVMIDGIALGIFLTLIGREIGIIDTIEPSGKKARRYATIGLISGSIYVLTRLLFTERYNLSDIDDLFDIFIELLIFTTLPGLIGSIDKGENLAQTINPNQGVWKSARYAGLFFGIFFPVGMLCSLNYAKGIFHEIVSIGLAVGLLAGMVGGKGPVFAGVVLIQHFTLRLMLWWQGYIPWNYARFLDYATERIFLRKVGGGYIFIHRRLQEHFTKMYPRTNN
ncbi:MAG: NACHT domain-containing protein [Okeania sp. SIO2F4]|uniref:NACHT domain-containing protein n=1 Tax=Okeania sp. SIO2F4 TaxID=2607790 RepID=UPI001429A39F|nr:NACHT domain-containing protein [Okeania sp. SIO2F4]NES07574.1 NACHT domain-containing protein [Okeania sp. SIO2F4]